MPETTIVQIVNTTVSQGERAMLRQCRAILAIFSLVVVTTAARAEDLRAAMEAANAQFLKAFNTPDPAGFLPLYTADAVLVFAGAPPIRGPEAITRFWESRVRAGARDHWFELIETGADGKYAYQFSRNGVQLIRDGGERTPVSGYTVRVFERQSDGSWKAKLHMFNRQDAP
jgi:ketosteroid isomerase-like protein